LKIFCGSNAAFTARIAINGFGAEFRLEVFLLALPDAVLAGAGAAHRLRPFHQAMHEILAARHFVAVVDIA